MTSRLALATMLLGAATASGQVASGRYRAVVLVTIDTLRADHLGLYGSPLGLTPSIDGLAADGVVYDQARSTCPATAPSVASMLTGHHRAVHGVVHNGSSIRPGVPTLAEQFRAAGYRTAAVVANGMLQYTGYDRGFESFALAMPDRNRPALFRDGPLVKAAGRLVRDFDGAPFFLWVHLMAPHGPYRPPPTYLRALRGLDFSRPGDHPLPLASGVHALGQLLRYQLLAGPILPARYRLRYAGEVRYADAIVGVLVNRLRRAGVWDDTLLVLTADHGESLGEHDLWFQHGWFVYDDTVRVPLVVRAPHHPAPARRVEVPVSLVDLAPTMLDLAGLPPLAGAEGRSLAARGTPPQPLPVFVQNYYDNHLVALATGRWKYVRTPRPGPAQRPNDRRLRDIPPQGREELYDVEADPGETRDQAAEQPAIVARLRAETDRWLLDQEKLPGRLVSTAPSPPPLAPAERRQLRDELRALGYAE